MCIIKKKNKYKICFIFLWGTFVTSCPIAINKLCKRAKFPVLIYNCV